MKKHLFLLFFIFTSALMFSQATGSVGIGTTNPDSSAALDISGIDPTNTIRGFLAPRMTLAQKIAIASPATGLLIYQTDDSIGFWYFDGTIWRQWLGNGWSLNGNAGTNPATDKVGTKDGQDFVLKTNNTESLRITSAGNVGLGTTTPSTLLHLKSNYTPATTYTQDFEAYTVISVVPTSSVSPNPYTIRNITGSGCVAGTGTNGNQSDVWMIGNANISATCTGCSAKKGVIRFGGSSCSQNETLVVGSYTATSTQLVVSFSYGFNYEDPGDEFQASLWNDTTNSLVTSFFTRTADIDENYTSSTITTIVGNTYSVRFRYKGIDGQGATVDNVNLAFPIVPITALQITDGNQALNKVLTCDATGLGTWENLPAAVTYDLDWIWSPAISGTAPFGSSPGVSSDNTASIYHRGNVKIGNSTASAYNLHVHNGALTSLTKVQFGSVEYIIDGINEFIFSDPVCPLTNANLNLGSSTNRWASVWAVNGTIQTSDISLKEKITPLTYGLKEIMQLKPVSFKWKQEQISTFKIPNTEKETKLGFIAQELQKIVPEVVETSQWKEYEENPGVLVKEEMARYGVSYSELIPVLIKAIQEQQLQIEAIKETNKYLNEAISKAEKKSKK
jgi:hypothetical protein